MHLVSHRGKLYAAAGFWEDSHNIWYGGHDAQAGWGQILRLDRPDQAWNLDLELGPKHLRPELLKEVTFTKDGDGKSLAEPISLLITATYQATEQGVIDIFTRDDESGEWHEDKLVTGFVRLRGEDMSVRAATVYTDKVTGAQKLFLSVGIAGLFTGTYDAARPGKINWARGPELPAQGTRILSVTEANGSLFYSDGAHVYRRVDGESPRSETIVDLSNQRDPSTSRELFSAIGGIRALTTVEGPVQGKDSLLYMWNPGTASQGCIMRLDPDAAGAYASSIEVCLAELVGRYLGAPIPFTAGAYNTFMQLPDPSTGEPLRIIGLDIFVSGRSNLELTAHNQRRPRGGMYAGAIYGLRDSQGHWRLGEVNGKYRPGRPELVSIYSYALSPFDAAGQREIYLGGYDPNGFPSTSTAWVYRADLRTLVQTRSGSP